MEPDTPTTPLESGVEMFTRGRPTSIVPIDARLGQRLSIVPEVESPLLQSEFNVRVPRPLKTRPLSEVTEIFSEEDEPRVHFEHDQIEDTHEDESEDDHSIQSEAEDGEEYMHDSEHDSEDGSEFEEDSDESASHLDEEGWRRSNSTISTWDDIQTPRSSRLMRGPALRLAVRHSCEGPRGPHLFRASTASEFSEFERALQLSPIVPDYTRSPDQYYRQSQTFEAAFDKLDTPTTAITETAYTIPPLGWGWQSEDPRSWTAQQVSIWMQESHMEPKIIQMFADNDIAGTVLMHLEFTDLKELGIVSFGKRHQVWNHICTLRNNHGHISPKSTPFEEGDDNRHSAHSKESQDSCNEPLHPGPRRKKKQRNGFDPITPADSVSIVAIEQLIPRPHKCARGENCQKWKKQQKLLRKLRLEHGLPISPEKGGHIFMAGNPGNAATASKLVNNVRRDPHPLAREFRPPSDAVYSTIGPSVVASSDLLGPGEQPMFNLDPEALECVEQRDPQDNVQAFLALQNVEPPVYIPPPFDESMPEDPDAIPDMRPPEHTQGPLATLQSLPRLQIPQTTMAPFHHPENPSSAGPTLSAADDFFSPCTTALTAAATPIGNSIYRFGTPASEMDVPVTQPPLGPVARDTSQSVPPGMQFRDPVQRSGSRAADWHRPSFQLAPVMEEGFTQAMRPAVHVRANSTRSANSAPSDTMGSPTTSGPSMIAPSSKTSLDVYDPRYPNVTHTGWMKKRKTKLLRHEWHEHHFRLNNQAQLTMHKNDMPAASALNTLNIDEYSVACSSIASNKLNARFKALKLQKGAKDNNNSVEMPKDSAFSFQLVPSRADGEESGKLRNVVEGKKTHHFAVKSRDERIDWMRELMLAKALREKEAKGYEVEINRSEKGPQSGRSSTEQQFMNS